MRSNKRALLAVLIIWGLASPVPAWAGGGKKHFKQGRLFEAENKFDRAAEEYMAALGKDPDNLEYQIAYRRAATQASVMLVRQGRELLEQGQYEEAYNAFRRAYQFDKTNELARDMARRALELQRKTEGVTPVPVEQTPYGTTPPIIGPDPWPSAPSTSSSLGQEPEAAASDPSPEKAKSSVIFHNTDLRDIIREVAEKLGLNVAFDHTVRSRKIDVELRDITLAQALDTILKSNQLFFEPVNDNTIIVAQDTQANRARLQQMSVQTFYLKSSDEQTLQTIQQTISALFGNRVMVVPNAQLRSLTVRTTPKTLEVIGNIIKALDKDKPEVLIDISIYEVSRNDLLEIGNQLLFDGFFGQNAPQGPIVPGTLNTLGVTAGQILTEQRLALAVPTSIIRALQTRGRSRLIDSLQVHALDGQQVTANVGQRIPIQTASLPTSFATLQQGQQDQNVQDRFINSFSLGVPQIEYQNVGLNVTVTPTIYSDDDVKLEMEIETSGVQAGPTSLTPIFTTRRLQSVATVKTGQAAMMAGVAQRRQTTNRTSLPIIGFLPVIGRFFSIPQQTTDTTDLIITVTPHIIRSADITEEDKLAMATGAGLQALGASESIESFLREREQARQRRRKQKEAATEVARQSSPPSPAPMAPRSVLAEAVARASSALNAPAPTMAAGLPSNNGVRAEAAIITIGLHPEVPEPRVGQLWRVVLSAESEPPIERAQLMLRFDPSVLKIRRVTGRPETARNAGPATYREVPGKGAVIDIPVAGGGEAKARPNLAVVEFEVLRPGRSTLQVIPGGSRLMTSGGRELGCQSAPLAVVTRAIDHRRP